ncbi:SDR family oxidoreductase [Streptomyces alanosinicus]|uniref:SDR family oxidoreductase n=1 Tax=Streptomyces alanosinicus TaxID=68171 RepID=UPI001679BF52|nr:SDR family oxidoreductase [Streptomyces alanosinicus]
MRVLRLERVRGRLWAQDPAVAASKALRFAPGDLTGDGLGMDRARYDRLSRTVDEVYHCGASMNMAAPYRHLASVNVGATARVVEFCRRGRVKRLHHLSTLGVFLAARESGRPEVDERTPPSAQTCGRIGYPRSKFEAETLVAGAAAQGLPVTVYRPGLVLADSRSGVSPADDFVARLHAAAVLTGCHPLSLSRIPVVPVDYTAEMIAELSPRPAPTAGAYHVLLPEARPAVELFDQAKDYGYPLVEVPPDTWRAELKARGSSRTALAMRTLAIAEYILGLSKHRALPDHRCEAVTDVLRRLGRHERLGSGFFTPMFRSFIDRNVLPPLPPLPLS